MFSSADSAGTSRRLACTLVALAVSTADVGHAHASGLAAEAYAQRIPVGTTAMLRLRVPFGGEAANSAPPMVGLSLGSSWANAPGSTGPTTYRFVPSLEAGLTFRGEPILTLGAFDMRSTRAQGETNEEQRPTFCGRNLGLCIIVGAALLGGIAYVIACERRPTGTTSCWGGGLQN